MQAVCAERMHFGRSHKKNVVNHVAAGNGAVIIAESFPVESESSTPLVNLDRRTRAWRTANPVAAVKRKYAPRQSKAESTDALCFCPRCGLNVAIARTAMIVALRHS